MQLNQTTLQNYEPEPPPAFTSNSPRESVDEVITKYSSQKQPSSFTEPNDEATIVSEENSFVGQR
jgi:hypothetical protein